MPRLTSDKKMKVYTHQLPVGKDKRLYKKPLNRRSKHSLVPLPPQSNIRTYNNITAPNTASNNPPPGAAPATANPVDVAVSTGLVGATVGATGACVVVAATVAVFCAAQNVANEAIAAQTNISNSPAHRPQNQRSTHSQSPLARHSSPTAHTSWHNHQTRY